MKQYEPKELAKQLQVAKSEGKTIEPFTARYAGITKEVAYQIQRSFVHAREAENDLICGNKVGLTNQKAQASFEAEGPVLGYLTERMIMTEGRLSMDSLINPKAEIEIAFVMESDLKGPEVTAREVKDSVESLRPAIEVIDSRIAPAEMDVRDLVADNVGASRVIIGEGLKYSEGLELSQLGMVLKKNGHQVDSGTGSEVMGNPVNSIVWLANELADFGDFISQGSIVISGAMNTPLDFEGGDQITARVEGLGTIGMRCG